MPHWRLNGVGLGGGLEVAVLVEDVVGGEEGFVDLLDGLAVGEDGGGIAEGGAGAVVAVDETGDQGDGTDGCVEAVEDFEVEGDEAGLEDEVLWRVAGDG